MSTGSTKNSSTDSISLADEQRVKEVLIESVLGLWDVVNNLTRLKPSKQDRFRVTIFGSARLQPGSFGYEETRRTAAALADIRTHLCSGALTRIRRRPL